MSTTADDAIRASVRETYSRIAERDSAASDGGGCCSSSAPSASSCCDSSSPVQLDSTLLGYSDTDLAAVPDGADLGLGCGNPG
ncbi:MAG TPA: hypothetical protein VLN74_16540, partial [Ilumatobacteraceae bacterium]|nr:hypothetical protein [Ilumatobacteraceae bacterium]